MFVPSALAHTIFQTIIVQVVLQLLKLQLPDNVVNALVIVQHVALIMYA